MVRSVAAAGRGYVGVAGAVGRHTAWAVVDGAELGKGPCRGCAKPRRQPLDREREDRELKVVTVVVGDRRQAERVR